MDGLRGAVKFCSILAVLGALGGGASAAPGAGAPPKIRVPIPDVPRTLPEAYVVLPLEDR
jgi:hypothetical protein